jgi:hypothetical protein
VETFSESVRRITTYFLAAFIWLHALFLLNIDSTLLSKFSLLLRLTAAEVILFSLLVIFTCVSGSGFWKPLRSLAIIYFFPFAVMAFGFYVLFKVLRGLHRWFTAQANPFRANVVEQTSLTIAIAPTESGETSKIGFKKRALEVLQFLLRPFRRFIFLWCLLLLVTTHKTVVWVCLTVVLIQLARKIFLVLKAILFSGPFLTKIGTALLAILDKPLAGLAAVTSDAAPTNDLKNLWNQLNLWRKSFDFLKDPYLLSRWAWVVGIVFVGSVYLYFAILFSFAYYGLARVGGVNYPWPDALVSSIFIPFAYADLPRTLWIRLLSGIHASLVVTIGIGTVVNFLRRRLDGVRKAATDLSDRLTEPEVRQKLQILEVKITGPASTKSE